MKVADIKRILEVGCAQCKLQRGKYIAPSLEDAITCYWACNITDNAILFDFEENILHLTPIIEEKLIEHGVLGPVKYQELFEERFGMGGDTEGVLQDIVGLANITHEELVVVLLTYASDKMNQTYGTCDEFVHIKQVHDALRNIRPLSTSQRTLLFDRAIHLTHTTGNILEVEVDIEELREQFEIKINLK